METLQALMDFLKPYWSGLALAATWMGIGALALRHRRHWRSKQFLAQVNFSLNYRVGDQLAMRTLLESSAQKVWPNEFGVRQVVAAASCTTADQPFILMKDPVDQDFVNRAVLNELSQRFAETFLAASLGLPVRTAVYYFAVTCEKYSEIRTLKLRVLIMEEQTMIELFGPEGWADRLVVRNAVYRSRLITLRAMYNLYLADQHSEHPALGKLELGVMLPGDNPLLSRRAEIVGSASPVV